MTIDGEEPFIPGSSPTENIDNEMTEPTDNYYTSQSTVADVLTDRAFGDFGRLLFPVDRNVSPSLTLAQVSTSAVYMWYPYIRVEKTVEILNYLHSQAVKGEQIFYNIYSPEEMAADPSKEYTGILYSAAKAETHMQ